MTGPATPEDLYRHGLRLLLDKDMAGWAALCAEDVVLEFPFSPHGYPTRLEGRAAAAGYPHDYPDHIDLREILSLQIHRTDTPGTIVAEWRAAARVVATGEPFEPAYVAVVTVEGGLMTRYRDYWNPLAMPASMGEAKTTGAAR